MSGPVTASFSFAPLGAVILAAEALREARAMRQEYAEAQDNARARAAALDEVRYQQHVALAQQSATLRQETERSERRLGHLQGICRTLEERFPQTAGSLQVAVLQPPSGSDQGENVRYAETMRKEILRIEALLSQTSASLGLRLQEELVSTASGAEASGLDEALNIYALQRSLQPGLSPEQTEAFRQTAARVLQRLELASDAVVPQELETLAGKIVLAPSLERAEELASELRLGVQRYRDEQAVRQQQLENEAAALVLEQSLRDLGYEVEGVENTLFVEGGIVHFQRPGWENYYVRLRLDSRDATINFNVVRPRGAEESEVRRRLDTLAEDRWCAEFPQLLKTLEARGLRLKVTRQLAAGELPVQVVDPATLPQPQREEPRNRAGAAPLRSLK